MNLKSQISDLKSEFAPPGGMDPGSLRTGGEPKADGGPPCPSPGGVELVIQCAWCRRVKVTDAGGKVGKWESESDGVPALPALPTFSPARPARVSHGICPECFAVKLAEIKEAA